MCLQTTRQPHHANDRRPASLFLGVEQRFANLQILDIPCRSPKTMLETLSFVEDEYPFLRRCSLETYAAVIEPPKLPQHVIRRRCKALAEQDAYDFPVCSAQLMKSPQL